jgi:hypothetical protein
MQRILHDKVTWGQQPNGTTGNHTNCFAVTAADVKVLPTTDADIGDVVQYDFRGKPSLAAHAAVASFMRQPTTNLPYIRRVSRYAAKPGVLGALQEWLGANEQVVPVAVSGAPRVAQATSEDIGRALTLRALRAPADGGRLASSRSTSASTVAQFVLCNGQVTSDGVPRSTWAESTICRCGLSLLAPLPTNHSFPKRPRRRCGNDGLLANEHRRRASAVDGESSGSL